MRDRHRARRGLRGALLTCSLGSALVACGGGGGGPATGTLRGQLIVEQSGGSSAPAVLDSAGPAPARDSDREPNDLLYCAVDLGAATQVVFRGTVGSDADRRDVYRLGPCPADIDVSLSATSATLTVTDAGAGEAPRSAHRISAGGRVSLARGRDVTLIVESAVADRYRIVVEPHPASQPVAEVGLALSRAATDAIWAATVAAPDLEFSPGEVLIACPRRIDPATAARLGLDFAGATGGVQRWRSPSVAAFGGLSVTSAQQHADLLRRVRRACPDARWVSPNLISRSSPLCCVPQDPNDPLFLPHQFNLKLTGYQKAWDITTGRDDVVVAVMDTGILPKHPEFAGRISPLGFDFISDPEVAGDGDGVDNDPSEPESFATKTFFHGTYVTGVLAAGANNKIGVAGAMWKGKVMPIRAFGFHATKGFSTVADRVQAFRYVGGLPNASGRVLKPAERPRVLSMSFIIPATIAEKTEIENIESLGILMLAAVGNAGLNPSPPVYPAAYPEVLAVGSVSDTLAHASYSNAGDFVDVVAPGGLEFFGPKGVASTWGGFLNNKFIYDYSFFRGTSVATPCVTGCLALMEAVHPNLEPILMRRIIKATARDLGPTGRDIEFGDGLLQCDRAVARAKELNKPPVPALQPATHHFADSETSTTFSITNVGGRLLRDLEIVPANTNSGGLEAVLSSRIAPATLRIDVHRDKVRVGRFEDSFELRTNGGQLFFSVGFRRPIPPPPSSIEVRVWRGETLVASATTSADGRFDFAGLPVGSYRLEAGVDRNKNGRLGDSQEWYLSRTVEVVAGTAASLGGLTVPWKQ